MNGSSLFGGGSFGTKYESGATVKSDSLSATGVVVNVTDEKGVFSISDAANNTLEITVDGNLLTSSVGSLISVINGASGTIYGLEYKTSLKVEIVTSTSGTVTVTRLS